MKEVRWPPGPRSQLVAQPPSAVQNRPGQPRAAVPQIKYPPASLPPGECVESRPVAKKPDPDDLTPIGGEPAEELTGPISPSMSSVFNSSGMPIPADALASLTDVLISEPEGAGAAAPSSDVSATSAELGEDELPPGLSGVEPLSELSPPPTDLSAPPAAWGEVALVGAPGGEPAEAEKEAEGAAEKKDAAGKLAARQKLLSYLEWSALGCLALALLAVGYFHVIFLSTAVYSIALLAIGQTIWLGRKTNTVYTVFLGSLWRQW